MTEVSNKIIIAGKDYEISKLRLKHLRKLSEVLLEVKRQKEAGEQGQLYDRVNSWGEFIIASIQIKHPEFGQEQIDEMTMDEVLAGWNQVLAFSSVQLVGETKTAPEQTGDSSTQASASPSAGPIVM